MFDPNRVTSNEKSVEIQDAYYKSHEQMGRTYSDYGCELNSISVEDLFSRYRDAGFLYPDKLKRLLPVMEVIKKNWHLALSAKDDLHHVVTYSNAGKQQWASVSSWRSTFHGWVTQHLAAIGNPLASRAVMLADGAIAEETQMYHARQIWFRRSNRFANKLFGSIRESLNAEEAWIGDHAYFEVDLKSIPNSLARSFQPSAKEVASLASRLRSKTYVMAEELDSDDLELDELNELYNRVGLRRYRRVYGVEKSGRLAGIAIAHRGPLGLNFSFLENRCDLLIDPALDAASIPEVLTQLLQVCAPAYEDFELPSIPVTIDTQHAPVLNVLGGRHVRDYAQTLCLNNLRFYNHVDSFYFRILNFEKRRAARKS